MIDDIPTTLIVSSFSNVLQINITQLSRFGSFVRNLAHPAFHISQISIKRDGRDDAGGYHVSVLLGFTPEVSTALFASNSF